MFCPRCGKEIYDGASFCPECGNVLSARKEVQPYPKRKIVFALSFAGGLAVSAALSFFGNFIFLFLFFPIFLFGGKSSSPVHYIITGALAGLCVGTLAVLALRFLNII